MALPKVSQVPRYHRAAAAPVGKQRLKSSKLVCGNRSILSFARRFTGFPIMLDVTFSVYRYASKSLNELFDFSTFLIRRF
jgi:hypothetical protein